MRKKRYFAPGKLYFRLVMYAGNAWTTVDFKGGRAGGYGEYMAYFDTDDKALQHLIERSPEFRNGIVIRGEIEKEYDDEQYYR